MTGRVQTYDQPRSWGWIVGDDGARYFLHRTDIIGKVLLPVGERVEFEAVATRRGPRATRVRRIAWARRREWPLLMRRSRLRHEKNVLLFENRS